MSIHLTLIANEIVDCRQMRKVKKDDCHACVILYYQSILAIF